MKKLLLLTLALTLGLGTIIAALPQAMAGPRSDVRFYVWRSASSNNIYPSIAVDSTFYVEVWIDAPDTWDNTAQGIVQYAISIRVNPTILEPMLSGVPMGTTWFLQNFLTSHTDPISGEYWADLGYTAVPYAGAVDKITGTISDHSEVIMGPPGSPIPLGAAGGPIRMCRFQFKSKSASLPSYLDICGVPVEGILEMSARYWTPDNVVHHADIMDDGYYISTIANQMEFDLVTPPPYNPLAPIGSRWHELWPVTCPMFTLTSWDLNQGGAGLDASDQIDLTPDVAGPVIYGHVDWINPSPTPNDGKADLIITLKEGPGPEFPLGITILFAIAPAIPILYLWRSRSKKKVK